MQVTSSALGGHAIELTTVAWGTVILAALIIGISKTGLTAAGILAIALFAMVLPARASIGTVLPLLVTGDLIAVALFRRNVVWPHLTRLIPATAVGVVLATFAMKTSLLQSNEAIKVIIGAVILTIVAYGYWDRWKKGQATAEPELVEGTEIPPPHLAIMIVTGLLAGALTMIANAAGPLMVIYLLASGLPKKEFLGTGAFFYLIVNLFKIPFSAYLGLINPGSIGMDAVLIPVVVAGAFMGRWLVLRIPQKPFEVVMLCLALVSGLNLLIPPLLKRM